MQLVCDELSPVIERLGAGHRCVAPRSKCYQPLFTAFGPKAIEHRLKISDAKLVVTDIENRSKLDEANCKLPVLSVTSSGEITIGDLDFHSELARQPRDFSPVMRRGSDLFLFMSTSGTTGLSKEVPVPLKHCWLLRLYARCRGPSTRGHVLEHRRSRLGL
jgi:acetyl-CoA synthetase